MMNKERWQSSLWLRQVLVRLIDRDPLKARPDPFRDWRRLLYFVLLALILIFSAAYFLYGWLNERALDGFDVTTPTAAFNRQRLEEISKWLTAREEKFQQLSETVPAVSDPGQ